MGKYRVALILSGCGFKDGSEIHETTMALYSIAKNGGVYEIFAPDMDQADVIDCLSNTVCDQTRSVLKESARIARGEIRSLEYLNSDEFDALVIPGGFGAAKNLFTFAFDDMSFSVREDVKEIIADFHRKGKPIGAMCIAPLMIAKILGEHNVRVTLGPAEDLSKRASEAFGAQIVDVDRDSVVVDIQNRVVSTPSYMYGDSSIVDVADGADRMIKELFGLLMTK